MRSQLRNDYKARADALYREHATLVKLLPADEHFLPEPAAAKFLGLKHESLQALRRAGIGPTCFEKRRRYSYRRSDLIAWRTEHRFD